MFLVLLALAGCQQGPTEYLFSGATMGTYYNVRVVFHDGDDTSIPQSKLETTVQAALDDVNNRMSTYDKNSELSRFNEHHSTEPFGFSQETFDVIALAQQVSVLTGGAFDITVGPLVNAWGFGPEEPLGQAPPEARIRTLMERVGYDKLVLDPAATAVAKKEPDIYCDLSAIAKGYGVDRAAEALDALGVQNYMVEVGGEVRTRGINKHGQPWHIGIEKPDSSSPMRAVTKVVTLRDQAMATSGDYRNYYEQNGVRISHTIDPHTGHPIRHRLASVSVVQDNCALADALATALMVLGPDEGYDLAVQHGWPVFFLVHDGQTFLEKSTPAFDTLLKSN